MNIRLVHGGGGEGTSYLLSVLPSLISPKGGIID